MQSLQNFSCIYKPFKKKTTPGIPRFKRKIKRLSAYSIICRLNVNTVGFYTLLSANYALNVVQRISNNYRRLIMNTNKKQRDSAGDIYVSMSGIDLKIAGQTILDHVDVEVRKGELLAFVGGNGAGKSSILRCMAGLWKPDSGKITIAGLDRIEDDLAIRMFTSYLPPELTIPKHLTVRESVRIFAEAYSIPEELYRKRMDSLLRMFGMKNSQDKMLSALSKGEKKKTALTCALISGAEFYILDEPFTDGIDPQGYNALRNILDKLAANRDITAVFATQILDMAVSLADRIAVVNFGRVLAVGTPEELRKTAKLPESAPFDEVFAKLASRESTVPTEEYIDSLKTS